MSSGLKRLPHIKVVVLLGLVVIGAGIGVMVTAIDNRGTQPIEALPETWLGLDLNGRTRVLAGERGVIIASPGELRGLDLVNWQGTRQRLALPDEARLVAAAGDLFAVIDERSAVTLFRWPDELVHNTTIDGGDPRALALQQDGVLLIAAVGLDGASVTALRKDRTMWTADLGVCVPLVVALLSASGDAVVGTVRLDEDGVRYEVHRLDSKGVIRWRAPVDEPPSRAVVSPDGRLVGVATGSTVHVLGPDGPVWTADCEPGRVVAVAVSDDGSAGVLVEDTDGFRVLLCDRRGLIQWSIMEQGQAGDLAWHPGHGFVVVTARGAMALDRSGRVLWRSDLPVECSALLTAGVTNGGAYLLSESRLWLMPLGWGR